MKDVPRSKLARSWLAIVWLVAFVTIVLLYFIDVAGDRATSNVLMIGFFNLACLATLGRFLFDGRRNARLRLAVVGALLLTIAVVALLYEVTFSGGLIPRFDRRVGQQPPWQGLAAPVEGKRPVDLSVETEHDFPGFLGPNRDNRVDGVTLATDLSERPPEEIWRRPVGFGLGGFAVRNGFAVTLEERDSDETAVLYDVDTGAELWSSLLSTGEPFGGAIIGRGPRSTPLIDSGVVYAQSVRGEVFALHGATGRTLWSFDPRSFGDVSIESSVEALPYGRSPSPLVVGERLIVPVGGGVDGPRVSVVALDKRTGQVVWQGGSHQISMSSPGIGTLVGLQQVLLINEDWAAGHSLESGEQLWQFEWPGKTSSNANVSQAIALPPDRIFVSKGYGIGSAVWKLEKVGGQLKPMRVWHESRSLRTKFTNVAIRDGYAYGLSEGILECVDLETGKRAWKAGRYGHGQILLVGEVLMVLTEDGEMVYVEASESRKNNVLASFRVLDGQTWNPFALVGDRLLVRNSREAAAFRLP